MVNVAKSLLVPIKKKGPQKNNNIFYDEERVFIYKMRQRYSSFRRNPDADNSHIKFWTNVPPSDNVPIICANKEEMYEQMRDACRTMGGSCNFVLGMLTDDGVYQVWRRPNQPCQGGEMRKYGCTHDDCTRPDDPRPGDLYYPFPDGKPLAVGARVSFNRDSAFLYINPISPYRRAYGHESNVEIVKKGNTTSGILMLNADLVEPTMFVTLIKTLRNTSVDLNAADKEFLQIATVPEYLLLKQVFAVPSNWHPYEIESKKYYDGSSSHINLKKYLKGGVEASYNLAGGSLGNRFDYHRPRLLEVFKSEIAEENEHINNVMAKTKFEKAKDPYKFLEEFRDVYQEMFA